MFSFNKFLYCLHNFLCHCTQLDVNNNNLLCLLFSFTLFCVNTNNCSLDIYNAHLQATIISLHATHLAFPFISPAKQSHKCPCRRMTLPSQKFYNCCLRYCYLCILFTFVLAVWLLPACLSCVYCEPRLFSSYATRPVFSFISPAKQSNECTWSRKILSSGKLWKCCYIIVVCVFCLLLPLQSCICLFVDLFILHLLQRKLYKYCLRNCRLCILFTFILKMLLLPILLTCLSSFFLY